MFHQARKNQQVMKNYSIIIQGEGKGHFSQAMVVAELLESKGKELKRVYIGCGVMKKQPHYFTSFSGRSPVKFLSPSFIRSPDNKGIRVTASLLFNFLLSPVYIFEICRVGILLLTDRSNVIFNFYDPIGGLAARWFRPRASRVAVSHHFYLSHPSFIHPHGMENSFFWLWLMNRLMVSISGKVMALSFRKEDSFGKIEVVPPLIDSRILAGKYKGGSKDLCYFLTKGYAAEMVSFYLNHPEHEADIFTAGGPGIVSQANITVFAPSREMYINRLLGCKRLICSAGFDAVAEAIYLGIPVFLLPTDNHYEQLCNAIDAGRTGMAFHLDSPGSLENVDFEAGSNEKYRDWAQSGLTWLEALVFEGAAS